MYEVIKIEPTAPSNSNKTLRPPFSGYMTANERGSNLAFKSSTVMTTKTSNATAIIQPTMPRQGKLEFDGLTPPEVIFLPP